MLSRMLRRACGQPPFLVSFTGGQANATASSLTVNLPEYAAGDFCIIHAYKASDEGTFLTVPGFTLDATVKTSNLGAVVNTMSKVMVGDEGATINLAYTGDSGSGSDTRAIRYVICMFRNVKAYVMASTGSVATTSPNPPSVSPGWNAGKKMTVLYSGITNATALTALGTPAAGYTLIRDTTQDSTGFKKFTSTQTEDPGSWGTYDQLYDWVTVTYAMEGK